MFDRVVLFLTPFQLKFNTFREGFQTTAQIGFIFLGRVAVGFRFFVERMKNCTLCVSSEKVLMDIVIDEGGEYYN